jgi:hypothetical protein
MLLGVYRMSEEKPSPIRYFGLDIHKHYLVAVAGGEEAVTVGLRNDPSTVCVGQESGLIIPDTMSFPDTGVS